MMQARIDEATKEERSDPCIAALKQLRGHETYLRQKVTAGGHNNTVEVKILLSILDKVGIEI